MRGQGLGRESGSPKASSVSIRRLIRAYPWFFWKTRPRSIAHLPSRFHAPGGSPIRSVSFFSGFPNVQLTLSPSPRITRMRSDTW